MLSISIIGHLGADAVAREQNGKKFVTFRVAHTERFDRADGTHVENTSWVSCVINGDGGGLLPFLKRGTQVYCAGDGSFRLYSSEKARGFVASGDIRVRQISLLGGNTDLVPSRLYTDTGELVNVYKAFFVESDKLQNTDLRSQSGKLFHVDKTRFVFPHDTADTTDTEQQGEVQVSSESAAGNDTNAHY